jgi:glycosyltransferase involved in cell wall biosynthesis
VATLRVGIDGRAFSSPAAGIRRYVSGLTTGLRAFRDSIELVALGGTAVPAALERVDEPAHPPTNLGWTLVGLPRAASLAQVDLIHAPAYTAPFWAGVPAVVTIHDVSYARHPAWYPYRRDILRRAFYRRSARAAAHVITDSEFSAREIAEMYGIPRERMTVVPLAVSAEFKPGDPTRLCELPSRVVAPFLLHVGDLHERRNVGVVVEALLQARRHFGVLPALSLVLAGVDRGVGDALCALAARAGAPEAVVRLGPVGDEQLRALYQCAAALVYPSRYEGFGLPLLEAMASGLPVIASRSASIPEVVGDAGILVDPDDVAGWTGAIVAVVNDEAARSALRGKGLARASAFTWEATARATVGVYRRVVRR